MTDMRKIQRAYTKLQKSHKNIRKAFSRIDDSLSEALLGEYDSPKLRRSLRKYGSGHRLHGAPRSIAGMTNTDALILIAGTSPKLSKSTDFDPTLPLLDMSYWRDGKRLRPQVRSTRRGEKYRLYFMSWHQNFTIHGEDDDQARRNLNLVNHNIANFQVLVQKDEEKAAEFINACKDWFISNGKPMVIVSDYSRENLSEPISKLMKSPHVSHIKSKLRGKNYQIMGQISAELP